MVDNRYHNSCLHASQTANELHDSQKFVSIQNYLLKQ